MSLLGEPTVSKSIAFEIRITARTLPGTVQVNAGTNGAMATEQEVADALAGLEDVLARVRPKLLGQTVDGVETWTWKRGASAPGGAS